MSDDDDDDDDEMDEWEREQLRKVGKRLLYFLRILFRIHILLILLNLINIKQSQLRKFIVSVKFPRFL